MAEPISRSAAGDVSPERRAKVDSARERWIRALIDKSRRNSLLYFRPLKTGTLEITGADPKAMERLLKREEVPLAKLVAKSALAEGALAEIRKRALANSEERGLETLFLTMGMATWQSSDGERPPEAPVLLIPLKIQPRSRGSGFALVRTGEIQSNLVLLHVLEAEHRIKIEADDLLKALQGDDEGEIYDPEPVYQLLSTASRELAGFAIADRLVIGNFAFQKTAMVKDLRECAEQLAGHDLIAAISGDSGAQRLVSERRSSADPTELDRTAPDDEFLFLDADSSQQMVIRHALALQDGTIQGPPGTGKSQTIANLIAELASRGKRVLFVAEKRAALDVVRHRLAERGLEHLALDLHGAEISRRDVLNALQTSREMVRQTLPVDAEKAHAGLVKRRKRLQEHVVRMHSPCPPTGRSVFDVQGALLRLGETGLTKTRWSGEALDKLTPAAIDQAQDVLADLEELGELFLRTSTSGWNGAYLPDARTVRDAISLSIDLAERWQSFFGKLLTLCVQTGLSRPSNLEGVRARLFAIRDLNRILHHIRPEFFAEADLDALSASLAPAAGSAMGRLWSWLSQSEYRAALATSRRYSVAPKAAAPVVLERVVEARRLRDQWTPLASEQTVPRSAPTFLEIWREWESMEPKLRELFSFLLGRDLDSLPLEELSDLLERLARDRETPTLLPHLLSLEALLSNLGLDRFVAELRQRRPPAEVFGLWLEHAWYTSSLEQAREFDPAFAAFKGRTHDKIVEEFRSLDRQRIRIAADRVRRAHAERAFAVMNEFPTEDTTIKAECQRKRSRMTVRRLLAEAPHVTTALRPCWMASPLSVSHLLPADRNLFDIVLFDEASQVFPHDAIPALLRAPRAVVAGDRHQLPPTAFFLSDEGLEEVEEEDNTSGFESILDQMSGLFDPWSLDWHYRSLDEALIAFSNRHIYDDRLVTFPGPGQHTSIQHVLVEQPPLDGQEDSVSEEARRVVSLVLEHAAASPDESLGVIALGIKHQRRIEAALEAALDERPDLDEFFTEAKRERFFCKNLERVQGDERDAIILSVGYGKDRSGRLVYRFGPLGSEGGKRRLNVAITRARKRMTVVSSFTSSDMDPEKSRHGVELLRQYLRYVSSGGADLGTEQAPPVPLNDFEQGVHDALVARGINLLKQWGASRYRIDLVAQHPQKPGRHVLAIECDGATYHSAQSARDRDRLRQQHLEALGWRFHRIWSTDWFQNREDELNRALGAYEEAVAAADAMDKGETIGRRRPQVRREPPPTRPQRSRRPSIPNYDSIDQYTSRDLVRCVEYIMSDELLRTDEDVLGEMIELLGFERRGAKIVDRIKGAIRAFRSTPASSSASQEPQARSVESAESLARRFHLDAETLRQRSAQAPQLSLRDVAWGMFNEEIQELMGRGDFHGLSTRYYSMALFRAEEDREFRDLLKLSNRMTLQLFQLTPEFNRVRIVGADGCESCRQLDGTLLTIEQAIKTMPLPCPSCSMVVSGNLPGFCRCMYVQEA